MLSNHLRGQYINIYTHIINYEDSSLKVTKNKGDINERK